MSYVCPLCNGLHNLDLVCRKCSHPIEDGGRTDDYLGPYTPYRPIDDLKLTNGYPDYMNHECVHVIYCPQCGDTSKHIVREWKE